MQFRRALVASGVAHAGLVLAGLVALPSPKPNMDSVIASIPIDLVEVSDAPQMAGARDGERRDTPQPREAPQAQPRPTPEPAERARPVEAQSAPSPPPPPPPPPPQRVETPPPPAPPTPPARPQPAQQTDPDGMQRLVEQQRQEQQRQEDARRRDQQRQQEEARRREQQRQEEARRREQQQQRDQQRSFDAANISNLINRQQGAPAPQGQPSQQTNRQASLGNPQGTGTRLTQSETARLVGLIRDQIQPCWSPPVGLANADQIRVRIDIAMNPDGSLNGRPRIVNPTSDPAFRAVSESAVRAILRCSPMRLPTEMYDRPNGWRAIEFQFDPSQMG